jgi:predicted RNA binding protein YcfA (HicA-like mRNA interferase family)
MRYMAYNIMSMGNTYTARELLKMAKRAGFSPTRQKESHLQLKHDDGRATTIPMHGGEVPKGTANTIIKTITKKEVK